MLYSHPDSSKSHKMVFEWLGMQSYINFEKSL